MIILEDNRYQYNGYEIGYNGDWYISDSDGEVIEAGFSTDKDAEEFIDAGHCSKGLPIKDESPVDYSENDLPVNSTTIKTLKSKYPYCTGIAYVLKSQYGQKYASRRGICDYKSPEMMIYKSAEDARRSRIQRKSDFGIEEVKLSNGEVR